MGTTEVGRTQWGTLVTGVRLPGLALRTACPLAYGMLWETGTVAEQLSDLEPG